MNKRPIKLKPGYYDPADYLLVHKDHYADLLERTKIRIEGPSFKIDTDGIMRSIAVEKKLPNIATVKLAAGLFCDATVSNEP